MSVLKILRNMCPEFIAESKCNNPGSDDNGVNIITVTVKEKFTKTRRYTEHKAVAGFENGTEREYTFDGIEENTDSYVLFDYSDDVEAWGFGPSRQKTATIQKRNLNYFETTDRTEREISKEMERSVQKSLGTAIRYESEKPEKCTIVEESVPEEIDLEEYRAEILDN